MHTPQFPTAIDSTIRGAFVSCHQKGFQEFIMGRRPQGTSTHLLAGQAFARGLEVTRKAIYGDGRPVDEGILDGIIAAYAVYRSHDPAGGTRSEENKTAEAVAFGLIDFFCQYPPLSDHFKPLRRADGSPAVEFRFAIPIHDDLRHPDTNDPLLYCGRFDWLAEREGACWVVDEKTTSQLGQSWRNNWTLRAQLTGYCWAAREHGYPVKGAIIRGMSFLSKSFGHEEVLVSRPEHMIRRWYQQLYNDVERMIALYREYKKELAAGNPLAHEAFDFDLDSACTAYGGCPFQVLCTKEDPTPWVDQYFQYERWNPLAPEEHDHKATAIAS